MKDPYPRFTELGVTVDNFRVHPYFDIPIVEGHYLREQFYKGTNMLMMGLDHKNIHAEDRAQLYFHPNESLVSRIQTWPMQTRIRSAAAQLLVNEYQCAYSDMVDCYGVGIQQLVGVKRQPYMVGTGATWKEHEGTKCCEKLVSKLENALEKKGWQDIGAIGWHQYADEVDECKKLMRHTFTRTHVMNKWKVNRDKMLREYDRLKAILRLGGYDLEERKTYYDYLPF